MASSDFGGHSHENGRSGSSKRGEKNNSDKPKQPRRGLGVAQLEKIRLHNQLMAGYKLEDECKRTFLSSSPSSSKATTPSFFDLHPNFMMGFGGTERTNDGYGDFQPGATSRSLPNHNDFLLAHHSAQPAVVTLPLFTQTMEKRSRDDRCHSTGSINLMSDSSDSQDLDLDLKLSL